MITMEHTKYLVKHKVGQQLNSTPQNLSFELHSSKSRPLTLELQSNMKQSSNTFLFLQKETHTTQHNCCMKVDPYLMKHMNSNILYWFNFKFIPNMCYIFLKKILEMKQGFSNVMS